MTQQRTTRASARGMVQTVDGLVEPDHIGLTLLHEHVLVDIRPPAWRTMEQIGAVITLANRFAIDYGEVVAPGNYGGGLVLRWIASQSAGPSARFEGFGDSDRHGVRLLRGRVSGAGKPWPDG